MKTKLFLLAAVLIFIQNAFCQEKYDTVFLLNGKTENVTIVKNSSEEIECYYPGEDMVSIISKSKIQKILFRSGRIEECSEVVVPEDIKYDKIIFANGDSILAKIVKVSEDAIDYKLPNEELTISTYKTLISKVVYSSGREESFSSLLNIKNISNGTQWESVIVTYNEADTRGLERVGEISKASGWGGMLASGHGYNDAIKLIQKEAARMKCGLVLINANPNANNTRYGAGNRVNATAYRLPINVEEEQVNLDPETENELNLVPAKKRSAYISDLSDSIKRAIRKAQSIDELQLIRADFAKLYRIAETWLEGDKYLEAVTSRNIADCEEAYSFAERKLNK